jgi:predicted amidohydrolase YtcJ
MADLIFKNGAIYTVDKRRPRVSALAVKAGKIVALGSDEEIEGLKTAGTRLVDLEGRTLLPGFHDSHVHFADGGSYLMGIDLRDAADEAEFGRRVREFAAHLPQGEWITGGNWDHETWPSHRFPHRDIIDPFTAHHPVFVHRIDIHIALANSLALKMAGIGPDTPDPDGGEIERDPATGEPTGILKDTAMDLVKKIIPPPNRERKMAAIKRAMAHAASLGITSIGDLSSSDDFAVYQELETAGQLTLRINRWCPVSDLGALRQLGIRPAFGDSMLRMGTVKMFVDGSLGAGTAWLSAPYSDDPRSTGIAIYPIDEVERLVLEVDRGDLQLAVHALGDRAVSVVLDALEKAAATNGNRDSRHRIEHAQLMDPADFHRFRRLGVIASLQPVHCLDDQRWLGRRIGERERLAHPVQSFIRNRVPVILGTDWAVAPLNPMMSILAAVTRNGWFPGEGLSLEQAIEAYTLTSAFAEFQEHVKGSLDIGKVADLAVLDRDIFQTAHEALGDVNVDMTVFNGDIIYTRSK